MLRILGLVGVTEEVGRREKERRIWRKFILHGLYKLTRLGVRYTPVNFAAGKRSGPPNR